MHAIKELMFKAILEPYQDVVGAMQGDGSVVWDNGYNIYQQFAGYYFAFLYTYDHPDNPHHQAPEALERTIACWNHYGSMIDETGAANITTFGKYWQHSMEEWGFFYWLTTYDLLKDRLDEGLLAGWRATLDRIYGLLESCVLLRPGAEKFADYPELLKKNVVYNHLVWSVLAMYRYGQIFGKHDAMDQARAIMRRIVDAQHPVGTWLEGGAPIIDYAGITLSAISLMELYDGDEHCAGAVQKGLRYLLSLTNPDFTKVLGVDERNRYNTKVSAHTGISFCRSPEGSRYLETWARLLGEKKALFMNVHGLCVACEQLRALPDEAIAEPLRGLLPPLNTHYEDFKLRVQQKGDFVVSFCGRKHEAYHSRWNMEHQGLLGIYAKGAFCGGASSIAQSEFSLFNVVTGGKVHYMHDDCLLTDDGAELVYGKHTCAYRILRWTERELTVELSVQGLAETERAFVNMPLYFLKSKPVTIAGRSVTFDRENVWERLASGDIVAIGDVSCSFDQPCDIKYPIFPYNSYLQVQTRDYNDVYGIATVELDNNRDRVCMSIML